MGDLQPLMMSEVDLYLSRYHPGLTMSDYDGALHILREIDKAFLIIASDEQKKAAKSG